MTWNWPLIWPLKFRSDSRKGAGVNNKMNDGWFTAALVSGSWYRALFLHFGRLSSLMSRWETIIIWMIWVYLFIDGLSFGVVCLLSMPGKEKNTFKNADPARENRMKTLMSWTAFNGSPLRKPHSLHHVTKSFSYNGPLKCAVCVYFIFLISILFLQLLMLPTINITL